MHNYNNEGRLEQIRMLASQIIEKVIKYPLYSNNFNFI